MIDTSPSGTGPNDICDYVTEEDVSIMNTKELFEKQDEIMDMSVDSKMMCPSSRTLKSYLKSKMK
jgi:hypothetical protein